MTPNFCDDLRWYFIHVLNGRRAVESLTESAKLNGISECFDEFFIPEVGGTSGTVRKNVFPGYVLVRMKLNNESWYLVKKNKYVVNFLGGDSPSCVPDNDVVKIKDSVLNADVSVEDVFELGDEVKVTDGPFAGFVGTVESIDYEKNRVTVGVEILGRVTPVELEISQVKSVSD